MELFVLALQKFFRSGLKFFLSPRKFLRGDDRGEGPHLTFPNLTLNLKMASAQLLIFVEYESSEKAKFPLTIFLSTGTS